MNYYSLRTKKTPQKIRTLFTTADSLPSDNVTALCFDKNGTLFAGTDNGLAYFSGDGFESVDGISGAVGAVFCADDGAVFVGAAENVFVLKDKKVTYKQSFDSAVVAITKDGTGKVWLATVTTCYFYDNGKFVRLQGFDFENTHCMTAFGDRQVFAACDKALLVLHGKRPRWSTLMPEISNAPENIRTLSSDSLGYVWVGTDKGIYLYDGKGEWIKPAEIGFFPVCPINKIVFGTDGTVYLATEIGVYVISGGKTRFLGKGRYIPSDRALDIAVKEDNSEYWIATDKGLSRIDLKPMSLSEKEAYFDGIMKYYNREDFYTDIHVGEYMAPIESGTPCITDNDGLWSALYVGALCFKYAVTKDEEIKERAKKAMKALIKLQTMTGISGFPARAYRRPGEDGFGNGDPEWHLTKDEKGELEWKGETSSDELVGHYFAAAYFYDLVADEEDKPELVAAIKSVTDHLIEHNFTLCDVDGLPTTWAHFGPEALNDNEMWCWEKGINSLELMAFVRITEHLTGDKKYTDLADELLRKHHYGMNLLTYKRYDSYANHIDDLLGILSVLPLWDYEKSEDMKKYLLLALRRQFEYEKIEANPIYNFVFSYFTGAHADIESAIETLEDHPLDMFEYRTDNSIRPDVEINYGPVEYGDRPQALKALPADERGLGRLSYEAFNINKGNDRSYTLPSEWLLGYWLGRYYGLIEE